MTAAFIAFAKQNAHKCGQDKPAAVRERSESTAVNLHDVAGSSPAGGAKSKEQVTEPALCFSLSLVCLDPVHEGFARMSGILMTKRR